jgi:hypothetical protein
MNIAIQPDAPLTSETIRPKRKPAWRMPGGMECIAVFVFLWIAAVALQYKAGAFAAEFSSQPDEAAHYVTGLMIRDYLASGHFANPLTYGERYYMHYPKVAIGMWPPLFHTCEALWMLVCSPSKFSVLLLMALITAATGALIYRFLRTCCSMPAALAGAALFVVLPMVQTSTSAVMADGLVVLLDLWAMMRLVRYLESERTRDAILFGILAALSMCTKANGVALVLLPAFALPIAGRLRLLRARGLYYAAAIVVVVGGPWQIISYRVIRHSLDTAGRPAAAVLWSAGYYGGVLAQALGWGLAPFCALGIVVFLTRLWRGGGCRSRTDLMQSGALALLLSVWVFQSMIGTVEPRYMVEALPAAVVFTVCGFVWVVRHIPPRAAPVSARALALGALAGAVFISEAWAVPRKAYQGFDEPAKFLLRSPHFSAGALLVISTAEGEGAFISEVAMRDQRPGHVVLRATKVLSSQTWYGNDYELRYRSVQKIRDSLDHAPISAVVLDTREPQARNDKEIFELEKTVGGILRSDPNWKLSDRFPKLRSGAPWIEVYTRAGAVPSGQITLDLRYTLGKRIVYSKGVGAKK